jgi:hypothetical protein
MVQESRRTRICGGPKQSGMDVSEWMGSVQELCGSEEVVLKGCRTRQFIGYSQFAEYATLKHNLVRLLFREVWAQRR